MTNNTHASKRFARRIANTTRDMQRKHALHVVTFAYVRFNDDDDDARRTTCAMTYTRHAHAKSFDNDCDDCACYECYARDVLLYDVYEHINDNESFYDVRHIATYCASCAIKRNNDDATRRDIENRVTFVDARNRNALRRVNDAITRDATNR